MRVSIVRQDTCKAVYKAAAKMSQAGEPRPALTCTDLSPLTHPSLSLALYFSGSVFCSSLSLSLIVLVLVIVFDFVLVIVSFSDRLCL